MTVRARLAVLLVVVAAVLLMSGPVDAQRQARIARNPGGPISNPGNGQPQFVIRCFVANCGQCNTFNPYICAQCNVGYQLSAGYACRSCQPGFEQNLDVQTFTCTKCPDGYTSNGGSGDASQCYKITATVARRLFEADEDMWA
jgi:hypothetical protein